MASSETMRLSCLSQASDETLARLLDLLARRVDTPEPSYLSRSLAHRMASSSSSQTQMIFTLLGGKEDASSPTVAAQLVD